MERQVGVYQKWIVYSAATRQPFPYTPNCSLLDSHLDLQSNPMFGGLRAGRQERVNFGFAGNLIEMIIVGLIGGIREKYLTNKNYH